MKSRSIFLLKEQKPKNKNKKIQIASLAPKIYSPRAKIKAAPEPWHGPQTAPTHTAPRQATVREGGVGEGAPSAGPARQGAGGRRARCQAGPHGGGPAAPRHVVVVATGSRATSQLEKPGAAGDEEEAAAEEERGGREGGGLGGGMGGGERPGGGDRARAERGARGVGAPVPVWGGSRRRG